MKCCMIFSHLISVMFLFSISIYQKDYIWQQKQIEKKEEAQKELTLFEINLSSQIYLKILK